MLHCCSLNIAQDFVNFAKDYKAHVVVFLADDCETNLMYLLINAHHDKKDTEANLFIQFDNLKNIQEDWSQLFHFHITEHTLCFTFTISILMAGLKLLLTKVGIRHVFERCGAFRFTSQGGVYLCAFSQEVLW